MRARREQAEADALSGAAAPAVSPDADAAMQVEAANDFEVSLPISILCGGLDRQIEHHLFPTLAPPRLREIAPRVRAIWVRLHPTSAENSSQMST